MRRVPVPNPADLLFVLVVAWAVLAPSRPVVLLAIAAAMVAVGAPRRVRGVRAVEVVRRAAPASAVRAVRASAPSAPGRPAVVVLPPRRPDARPAVSVASLAGAGGVRPLHTRELPTGAVRVGRPRGTHRRVDGELVAAGWELATRVSARRVDAAAVALGLATDAPRAVWATEPDPLLLAATWPRGARAAA